MWSLGSGSCSHRMFLRPTHVEACVSTLFLLTCKLVPTVWMGTCTWCSVYFLGSWPTKMSWAHLVLPAPDLESAISPKNLGYLYWGRLFRNQDLDGLLCLMLQRCPCCFQILSQCVCLCICFYKHTHTDIHTYKHKRLSYLLLLAVENILNDTDSNIEDEIIIPSFL